MITKTERRARAVAAEWATTAARGYPVQIAIVWRHSRTWGLCPRLEWGREKIAYANGCGYDKLSTVLADVLRWLPDIDHNKIAGTMGAGESGVRQALAEYGYTLTHVYDGRHEDAFTLTRNRKEIP